MTTRPLARLIKLPVPSVWDLRTAARFARAGGRHDQAVAFERRADHLETLAARRGAHLQALRAQLAGLAPEVRA